MAECIYCRSTAASPSFGRPDHVLPKAFGRFRANLTTFHVCETCNQWFGDNLEVSFGRNSGEAIMRLLTGVKPASEAAEVGGHRVQMFAGDGARFAGGRSVFTLAEDGRLIGSFTPQVAFQAASDQPLVFSSEEELTGQIVEQYESAECIIFAETEEDWERLTKRMTELGCHRQSSLWVRPDTNLPLVLEPVRLNYRLDADVFRTIGKIAFNYLAHAAGTSFCLAPDFDPFRRFVRYGEGDWRMFFRLSQQPLLMDEIRFGIRETSGHLLTVEWLDSAPAPVGTVKLFNAVTYHVRFATSVTLLWRDIRSGHHFNIKKRSIEPITIVHWPF